jgi:ATP-dependent RNA helicase RhlE
VYCDECFKQQARENAEPAARSFALRKPDTAAQVGEAAAAGTGFGQFNLDHRLHKAIDEAGYETPTPVQDATIPIGLLGRDLIGTAQTGTGKTAAFVLPILQHLLANPVEKRCTRAIVITPTRELAEQINETFKQLGKFTKIRSATVYGGVAMNPQEKALGCGGADVIVACPGRLLDHMDRGNTDFSRVSKLVLDEADRMLDMGFLPPIKRILSKLPGNRHSMLFSATFAQELTQLANDTLNNPQRVDVDLCAPPKSIAHALYPCPQHLKTSLVLRLLEETDTNSVLIFTRTKHRANRVAEQIVRAGYAASALHANKSQNQRQSALDDFREGRCQILVATDIAARGLDIATISHVINYDIPATADTYIHRIGRTGRMEREGDGITLTTPQDAAIVFDIEKALGAPIERCRLEGFDYAAPPPEKNEFKRSPTPPRKPRAVTSRAQTAAPKKAKAKTPGYFAQKRNAKARLSGGW